MTSVHGSSLEVIPKEGEKWAIQGIFRETSYLIDPGSGAVIETTNPYALVRYKDKRRICPEDTLVIEGQYFTVETQTLDGHGNHRLELHKCLPSKRDPS